MTEINPIACHKEMQMIYSVVDWISISARLFLIQKCSVLIQQQAARYELRALSNAIAHG